MENKGILRNVDWAVFVTVAALIIIGLVNIYSSTSEEFPGKMFSLHSSFGRQLMWVGITLSLFILIMIIDARFFVNIAYIFYALSILLLLVTLVMGKEVAGSKSWLVLGSFNLQTSEMAKFGTAMALSRFLDSHEVNVSRFRDSLIAFAIIFFPMGLIVLQNDIGSALVFSAFIFVLYRQGLHPAYLFIPIIFALLFVIALLINIYWIILGLIIIAAFVYWQSTNRNRIMLVIIPAIVVAISFMLSVGYVFNSVLQPHQQTRINVLLGKDRDLHGSYYNVHQSLIAIGSGGFSGKGFLNGTQTKFDFIPEQSTDFIFCTIAEEYGLLGSSLMIGLYLFLLLRILSLAEKQKNRFTRIFGYTVLSIIFIHFTVNLGMTLGLLPVIGIPLPFISYGGSSLLGFTLLMSMFLKFDADFKHYFN